MNYHCCTAAESNNVIVCPSHWQYISTTLVFNFKQLSMTCTPSCPFIQTGVIFPFCCHVWLHFILHAFVVKFLWIMTTSMKDSLAVSYSLLPILLYNLWYFAKSVLSNVKSTQKWFHCHVWLNSFFLQAVSLSHGQ